MQYLSQRLAADSPEARDAKRSRPAALGDQRERILDAAESLVAERGADAVSIEAIVRRAGVSSVTFYEHFRGKEECLLAAFDRAVGELRDALAGAVPPAAPREERLRAALEALPAALEAEPARARLCFVEAQRGGPRLRARYDEALDGAAAAFDDPLGQAIAGGLAWLVRERLELGGGGSVQDLLPGMTEVLLAPQPAHG